MKAFLILPVLFSLMMTVSINAQSTVEPDFRIDKDHPTVYLAFERFGKREPLRKGESSNGIWFRLHNNLKWPIIVPSFGVPYPDETGIYFEVEPIKDVGDRISFASETKSSKNRRQKSLDSPRRIHNGYKMRDLVSNISVPAGSSLLFSIPSEALVEGTAISVSFHYIWEENLNEPLHKIFFYHSNLQATTISR